MYEFFFFLFFWHICFTYISIGLPGIVRTP